jgi:homoserine O-acetyltransferase/O-succinyltransferase
VKGTIMTIPQLTMPAQRTITHCPHRIHTDHDLIDVGRLDLEVGGVIPACHLAVATFGTLSPTRDNAILVVTSFAGTHRTWRDAFIGRGRALDTSRYFVVVVNQIGGGLSTSPHNASGPNAGIAGSRFPEIRIGDDVVAQERLLREHFGIDRLELVVGSGMGAQQAYEWMVRFPEKVRRAAPIAGTPRTAPYDHLFLTSIVHAITSDPAFDCGDYRRPADVSEGLQRLAGIWAVLGFSTRFWKEQVWRTLGFPSGDVFIRDFLEPFFATKDPNDLLCMARKWQTADVARSTGEPLATALQRVTALTYVLPVDDDVFYWLGKCEPEAGLVPVGELRRVHNLPAHLGMFWITKDFTAQVDRHLRELLGTEV